MQDNTDDSTATRDGVAHAHHILNLHNRGFFVQHKFRGIQNAHTPRPKATSLSTSCRSASAVTVSPVAGRPPGIRPAINCEFGGILNFH
jgi:hypothetical protein